MSGAQISGAVSLSNSSLSPKWQQLHVRAAMIAMALLLALCAAMLTMLHHYSQQMSLEATQRMNLGLAKYIVDHQPAELIGISGQADLGLMKEIAHHVMMINPAVEVYLLDIQGNVLAHALDDTAGLRLIDSRVDLEKVRPLLYFDANPLIHTQASLQSPILGDDPRRPGKPNIVSISAIKSNGAFQGYLYLVLQSQTAQNIAATLSNSSAIREIVLGILLATLVAITLSMIALSRLTRPLRQLTAMTRAFRSEASGTKPVGSADEIKLLSAAICDMQERITLQFKRLEDSDQQKRELISNISHDLSTPLSNIRGYVETVLLRTDQLDPHSRAQHLRTALRHVELLGKRIGDLFELSKLDAGRLLPNYEVFCLAELLQDVVQNYQLTAQRHQIYLSLDAGSHVKTQVYADIALIERVLQNLVDNALRYTPENGEVKLTLSTKGGQIEVCVSDSGHGIAQEHLPYIFERYWRTTDPQEAGANTSSGLGLAIVKRILDLHGSVVDVRSELSQGTQFSFALPLSNQAY